MGEFAVRGAETRLRRIIGAGSINRRRRELIPEEKKNKNSAHLDATRCFN